MSPALAGGYFTTEPPGKPIVTIRTGICSNLGEGNASQKNPPGGVGRAEGLPLPSPPLNGGSTGRSWTPRRNDPLDEVSGREI